jgi:hypothetical protein
VVIDGGAPGGPERLGHAHDLLLALTDVGDVALPVLIVSETQHSSWSRQSIAVRVDPATP